MGAVDVPLDIDQGEDWTGSIVYTDDFVGNRKSAHFVGRILARSKAQGVNIDPHVGQKYRLDIKNNQGATQLSLITADEDLPDGTIPDIGLSSEIGLIQLHIEDSVTSALLPGVYKYDLFVTINDGNEYAGNQVQRLIKGNVTVNQRVTTL